MTNTATAKLTTIPARFGEQLAAALTDVQKRPWRQALESEIPTAWGDNVDRRVVLVRDDLVALSLNLNEREQKFSVSTFFHHLPFDRQRLVRYMEASAGDADTSYGWDVISFTVNKTIPKIASEISSRWTAKFAPHFLQAVRDAELDTERREKRTAKVRELAGVLSLNVRDTYGGQPVEDIDTFTGYLVTPGYVNNSGTQAIEGTVSWESDKISLKLESLSEEQARAVFAALAPFRVLPKPEPDWEGQVKAVYPKAELREVESKKYGKTAWEVFNGETSLTPGIPSHEQAGAWHIAYALGVAKDKR